MRCQHDNDFSLVAALNFLRKEIFQYRNVLETRKAVERRRFGICNNSTQNVRFTFGKPDFMLNLTVCENRLCHASNISIPGESTYLNLDRH